MQPHERTIGLGICRRYVLASGIAPMVPGIQLRLLLRGHSRSSLKRSERNLKPHGAARVVANEAGEFGAMRELSHLGDEL